MNPNGRKTMFNRTKAGVALACAAAFLTLVAVPATAAAKKAKKKTTVIGKVTHSNAFDGTDSMGNPVHVGNLLDPAILQTKTVKNPKPGSIRVNVSAVYENPAAPNSIYVSGVVECKKKPKDPITKYVIGGDYRKVPSPFSVKAPFPYGVPKPAACRLHISSNTDPPATDNPFEPLPVATITITVLWRH
jgi:hypothetical protein